jgi:transposase
MSGRDEDAEAVDRGRIMRTNRAVITEEAKAQAIYGTPAAGGPSGAHGHSVCIEVGHHVGNAAQGDGFRLRDDLLATTEALAASWGVEPSAPGAALGVARGEATGHLAGRGRQLLHSRGGGGKKSGPNPTDRRRAGSKHHLLTNAQGIPLSVVLTKANRNDVTQVMPLLNAIPPIAGQRGRPSASPPCSRLTEIARRYAPHGSGLGKTRWVVERTITWLHQFRRLRVRYERLPSIHEAFLKLGACLICWLLR